MKTNYYSVAYLVLLFLSYGLSYASVNDTIVIYDALLTKNLKDFTTINISKKESAFSVDALNHFTPLNDKRSFFYLDFDVAQAYSKFTLKNQSNKSKEIILSFSYPFLEDVSIYKLDEGGLRLEGTIGIRLLKHSVERTWKVPINLLPNEKGTYYLVFNKSKGKPLATDIIVQDRDTYYNTHTFQSVAIGSYVGLILLSFLFTILIFVFIKRILFLLYGLYLTILLVFIGSYLGYTNLLLPAESLDVGRTIYVISIELSTVVFILFAQQVLMAKKYLPKLKRGVEVVIIFQFVFRIFLHFMAKSMYANQVELFMKLWYLTIKFIGNGMCFPKNLCSNNKNS